MNELNIILSCRKNERIHRYGLNDLFRHVNIGTDLQHPNLELEGEEVVSKTILPSSKKCSN
jgi:hypothetical protein